MNKHFFSLLMLCLFVTGSMQAALAKRGFAIVVDQNRNRRICPRH